MENQSVNNELFFLKALEKIKLIYQKSGHTTVHTCLIILPNKTLAKFRKSYYFQREL